MGTSWDEVRKHVEPVVAEINQPDAGDILRVEVVVEGDDQPSVSAQFSYESPRPALNAALLRYAARLLQESADRLENRPHIDGPDARERSKHAMFVTTGQLEATHFVVPDTYNEEGGYPTPEEAALAERRRGNETPRVVSVEMSDDNNAEVEVDKGRHPADHALYRCVREVDGWWVEGSQTWFDEKPVNVETAMPSDDLGVFIVESPIGGYELVITGYDFRSTHMSHHSTIDDAKAYAESKGLPALDWQPWSPPAADS